MKKRILSMILVATMVFTSVDITALAQENIDVEVTETAIEDEEVQKEEEQQEDATVMPAEEESTETQEPTVEVTIEPSTVPRVESTPEVTELPLVEPTEESDVEPSVEATEVATEEPIITQRQIEYNENSLNEDTNNFSNDSMVWNGWEYIIEDEFIVLLKYVGEKGADVVVPAIATIDQVTYNVKIRSTGVYSSGGYEYSWCFFDDDTLTMNQIRSISFEDGVVADKDISNFFAGLSRLQKADLSGLDTSSVTNMSKLFSSCSDLNEVNLYGLDTSNVTNMSGMFEECNYLGQLNLTSFDTSSVTDMSKMFYSTNGTYGVSGVDSLDLSSFDTSNVTNMSAMFYGRDKIEKLDISNFDVSNVQYMHKMFSGCENLNELSLGTFDTSNVLCMRAMFEGCKSIVKLDLSGLDMSKLSGSHYGSHYSNYFTNHFAKESMFEGCENLKVLILPNSILSVDYNMFNGCNGLEVIYYAGSEDDWKNLSVASGNEILSTIIVYYDWTDKIFDGGVPTIWFTFDTEPEELIYENGYSNADFNLNISALCMLGLNDEEPMYENVTVEIILPEGLSFSDSTDSKTVTQNLGQMSLSGTKRQDMSFVVYVDEEFITQEYEVVAKLIADGYETPQTNTYKIPVSIIVEKPDETIIDTVERYTSDKEVQEILDIFNNSSSNEEIRQRLFEYYNYDNMLDVRERIIKLSDMHDERWDYEGLVRDDMYLSWQYYDYLNNTSKGAAARVALYASGLVFNGEINEWVDPTTYIDSELPGIKKYKSLLEEFIQKQSSSIELYTYMSEAEKFINSTVGVWSKTEKAEAIKKLKEAPDSVTCESIFNDFVANKISYGEKTMTYVYDDDDKPIFMEAMGITDTVFSVMNVTMDGIAGIVDISSNLETYQVYHSFLQEIYEADDLPWELVVAAYQLDRELEQAYWTPIQEILNEIRDECLDESFDAAGFENLLNKNGWLSAINYTAFCINQFVDVGAMVVNSCHTEGYAFLAMHYKNKLEERKQQFLANKTEENAWAFYEAYVMLWKLRIAGEEKFLQMSNLEGGKIVDGLSEAATGGTIAGLISDLCGYADKEAAINDNLKMLNGFAFKYSIKDEDLPDEYKYLQKVVIECPVSVEILTDDGTQVCVLNDDVETEITNEYGTFVSFYRATTGDYAKIAYFNDDAQYTIRAIGQDSGNVTYSSAKTEDHLTCTVEGFDNVIISENDIIHITTDDEKYTIDKEGDGTTDIEGEQADKNKTFVQFDYQDGKQIQVKYVNENDVVTMPEPPVYEGHEFKGWFTEPEGLGEEFTAATVVSKSMTVYAKWESKEKETLPLPIANIASGSVVEKTTEIILSCEAEEVQIYYTLDGTDPTTDSKLYIEPIVLSETTTIKAIAVKKGYNNSEVAVFTYTIAEGETVTFTVTFNSNGGSDVLTQTVEENQKAKVPEEPTRKGYLFKGWYLGDKLYDFDNLVTTDITLEARWEIDESQKQGDVLPEDIPEDGIIPEGMWIAGIDEAYTYTGKAIKPAFRVYDHEKLLKAKTDYTVSYKNNTKANNASKSKTAPIITVTGKGNYKGTETVTFKILKKDISDTDITASDITVVYNKKAQKKVPTVKRGTMSLKKDTDFTVSYPDIADNPKAYKAPGEYTIIVKGKGGYTGTREVKLTITESKLMSKVTVSQIATQPYTGTAVTTATMTKAPTVKYGEKTKLKEGIHYTVSYENNTKIGTATMILTGTDTETPEGTFTGTKKVTFKIGGTSLSKAKVTGIPKTVTYTGIEINEQTEGWGNPIKVELNGQELTRAADENSEGDYIVTFKNNTKKGSATVTIKGVNAYSGSIKKEFAINAYSINDNTKQNLVTEEMDTDTVYAKGGSKPEPVVMFGDTILVKGKDYTLTYANNTKWHDGTSASKRPTVTITGKGNFKGTMKIPYTIAKQDIGNMKISVSDVVYKKEKGGYKATPVVKDLDNKTLKVKTDYTVSSYTYGQDVTLKNGAERKAGDKVGKNDIVPAGTLIKVVVTGKGNYKNDTPLVAEYRVVKSSIAKATVTVPSQPYTGKAITIEDKAKIKVKVGKTKLDTEDFEIVDGSFKNNTKAGTASFTIRGVGNYGGTKKVTFKIKPKGLIWWWR